MDLSTSIDLLMVDFIFINSEEILGVFLLSGGEAEEDGDLQGIDEYKNTII